MPRSEFHSELERDLTLSAIEKVLGERGDALEHTGGATEIALAIVDELELVALGFKEGVYYVGASVPPA